MSQKTKFISDNDGALLPMYVIYHNVSDYPPGYVVRRWENCEGEYVPTQAAIWHADLQGVYNELPPGLVCFPRATSDDSTIVETWV